jgi:uncharacterized protein (TIGR03435 family)
MSLTAQSFEVASVRPNASTDHRVSIQIQPGGRFIATGIPVRALIGMAYNVRDFQITGGPSWMHDDRYDINAKAEDSGDRLTMEQMRPMLKALLAGRFGMKAHEESKEMPVYELVAAKAGHKLVASQGGGNDRQFRMGRGQINAKGVTMEGLAQQIAQQVGRKVIDKTGIEGAYDVELNWTPEPGQGFGPFGGPPPGALPQADSSGPSIFTALQEQLGLRLDSAKGPVPVVVIDSISKPTEN